MHLDTRPDGEVAIIQVTVEQAAAISHPETFDPSDKWPECSSVFTRSENQGACGSCWAFGATAALVSHLCTASSGEHREARLSRFTTSTCVADFIEPGRDACGGGWPT